MNIPFLSKLNVPNLISPLATKLLPWLNRIGLIRLIAGQHASTAMHVMSLIVSQTDKGNTKELVEAVYSLLPKRWKAPEGPATERELQAAVKQGIEFAQTLSALTTRN